MKEDVLGLQEDMGIVKKAMGEMSEIKAMLAGLVKGKFVNLEMGQPEGDPPNGETHFSETNVGGKGSRRGDRLEDSGEVRHLLKRVDLPSFHGDDPVGWIGKAEQFFELHDTTKGDRLKIAYICLEGMAVHWFRWIRTKIPDMDWERFAEELNKRYSGRKAVNPFELLASLRQGQGSVEEYITRYEVLMARIGDLPENQAMGYFVSGLREQIRAHIRIHEPKTIIRAMDLARNIEELKLGKPNNSNSLFFPTGPVSDSGLDPRGEGRRVMSGPWGRRHDPIVETQERRPSHPNLSSGSKLSSVGSVGNDRGVISTGGSQVGREGRIVSHQEYLRRKEKGLCFKCGEPFKPMHKCASKSMWVTILMDEEDDNLEECGVESDSDTSGQPIQVTSIDCGYEISTRGLHSGTLQLPLYSVGGVTGAQTMKFMATIGGTEVVTMVDNGASHNFVSRKLITDKGLPFDASVKFGVYLGDGCRVDCQGVCKNLLVDIGVCQATIQGYLFDLGGVDLILGVDWLRTLGEVRVDWSKMIMKFVQAGQEFVIQGDPTLSRSLMSLRSMTKTGDIVFCGVHFEDLFTPPTGLPPMRNQSHSICIREGCGPVVVRPYRYAYCQKNEMERLVKEMLGAGVIQPSCSPYSSPMVLIKKKDGSWRFCVDYRVLNEITIANKYPIPVVDELLDELHGAHYFSKLDLRSGYHQIRMSQDDVPKTAFRTHSGHYEFLVRVTTLIYSGTWADHLVHLKIILGVLRQHTLLLNEKKCCFGSTQVEYLGHVISGQGVAMDSTKIEAVRAWPTPHSVRGVRGFLGLTGYYRKFIRGYGMIAKPLTELLKKNNFK
ncbi:uncharacterized protein [Henckelia pumila]|uniref:uncharacterized protein n=1 Tax=Henckelia pumila TaxID=405737 RepID=UPI003C6DFB56